ncbi:helix-turn-helix domain-containing protein [Pullulanibacillus sp. KACC 23026]|uniref:helix-turn-helix domain-containing protein n=1 Tax=Pullulanibacillus sp. KACC 23026 TaxID=3028315 RepID=UPI0023B1B98C|nr:helix-turn-helix domain-containing protein [Pullulanibacillus sp. KACC 23026]WEG11555.1 helix-turn-helix domain-containing protein [Pullulanibacillus sp. KACC 23026]
MSELGLALREARETMELTLDDLQEKTKIQKRYLLAIEEGEYNRLPGQFYTRAFIKSYAEAVGLDPNELFETYPSEVPRSGSEIETLPPRNARETIRVTSSHNLTKNVQYLVMAIVGLAIAIGIYVLAQHLVSGNDSSAQSPSNDTSYKKAENLGNGTKASKPSNSDKASSTQSTANTDSSKSDNSAAKTKEKDTNAAAKQKIELTSSQGSYYTYTLSGADKFVLDVTATNQYSWLGVNDTSSTGKSYFADSIYADTDGKTKSFHQDFSSLKQVFLKVGNVDNVKITINGETLDVPKDPVFQHITIVYKK